MSSRRSSRSSRASVDLDDDDEGCEEDVEGCQPALTAAALQGPLQVILSRRISDAKSVLLRHLSSAGGDVTTPAFLNSLAHLRHLAGQAGLDRADYASDASRALEGMWLTLSRPNYHDCLGKNTHRVSPRGLSPQDSSGGGEYMYTLGRMSFDMFRPTDLVCSVQGVFNPCHRVDGRRRDDVESVPRGLRREMEDGETCLRTYNIVTAFTVETPPPPPSVHSHAASDCCGNDPPSVPDLSGNAHVTRPIRGIQTTFGYVLPDPQTPNRLSVWFTGGTLECNDPEHDGAEWRNVFCNGGGSGDGRDDGTTADGPRDASDGNAGGTPSMGGPLPRRRHLSERARVLAAKLLLGASLPERMEDDGTMTYRLNRPIGGHGTAYIDVLYLDDSLRILRGHHGTVYVFARVPGTSSEED